MELDEFESENKTVLVSVPVSEAQNKMRIDRFLAESFPEYSRNSFIRLIEDRHVQEQNSALFIHHPDYKVQTGQIFVVDLPDADPMDVKPEQMDLEIIYEDEDVLVVNKPAGLVVHPGAGNWDHTLVNGLLAHCGTSLSGIGGVRRPGIVHRIDKDTSGLLVVAKNDMAHLSLSKQFSEHSIQRMYQAFVWGRVEQKTGVVEGNIGRSKTNRQKMAIVTGGKPAITHYERVNVFGNGIVSHIRCVLETGRTHQIRVHMSSIHHALVGDYTYGHAPKNAPDFLRNFPRQALHAGLLGFVHPKTQKQLVFEVPLPEDMATLLEQLQAL